MSAATNELLSPAVARMTGRMRTLAPPLREPVARGIPPPLVANTVQGDAPPGLGETFLTGASKRARGPTPHATMLGAGLGQLSGAALPPLHILYPHGATPEQERSYNEAVARSRAYMERVARERSEGDMEHMAGGPGTTLVEMREQSEKRKAELAHMLSKGNMRYPHGGNRPMGVGQLRDDPVPTTTGSALYVGRSDIRPAPRSFEREAKEMAAGGGPLPMLLPQGSQQALEAAGPKPLPPPNGILMYDVNRAQYAAAPMTGKQARHSMLGREAEAEAEAGSRSGSGYGSGYGARSGCAWE